MALLKSTGSKKVNLDFNKEFINTFSDNIKNRKYAQLFTSLFRIRKILY